MVEGELLSVVEEDKGDGWTRVRRNLEEEGYVPTSYIKIFMDTSAKGAMTYIWLLMTYVTSDLWLSTYWLLWLQQLVVCLLKTLFYETSSTYLGFLFIIRLHWVTWHDSGHIVIEKMKCIICLLGGSTTKDICLFIHQDVSLLSLHNQEWCPLVVYKELTLT